MKQINEVFQGELVALERWMRKAKALIAGATVVVPAQLIRFVNSHPLIAIRAEAGEGRDLGLFNLLSNFFHGQWQLEPNHNIPPYGLEQADPNRKLELHAITSNGCVVRSGLGLPSLGRTARLNPHFLESQPEAA